MDSYHARRRRAVRELTAGSGGDEVSGPGVPLEPPFRRFSWDGRVNPVSARVQVTTTRRWNVLRVCPSTDDPPLARDGAAQLLTALPEAGPSSFEIIAMATPDGDLSISIQLAVMSEAERIGAVLSAHFPGAEIFPADDLLPAALDERAATPLAYAFRLNKPYAFSLRSDHATDPYGALLGVMATLRRGETAAFQVLFCPTAEDWGGNLRCVSEEPFRPDKSSFRDLPELPKAVERKIAWPLYAGSVRVVASRNDVANAVADFLQQYTGENRLERLPQLVPTSSIVQRLNHVPGMILNAKELAALVHLPAPHLASAPGLQAAASGGPPPRVATVDTVVRLGRTRFQGKSTDVGLSARLVAKHVAVFGSTGSGKTNLLLLLLAGLARRGLGFAFLDANGDAAEMLLQLVPAGRVKDTIYFNPADRQFPPAFNVLEASDERERELLAADLLVAFSHLFERWWGYQQEVLLRQVIMTLLFSKGAKTLRDIPRLIQDPAYRQEVLATVEDADIHHFWRLQFPNFRKDTVGSVLSKVSKFVDNRLVRAIIAQPNLIDFHRVVNEGMIFVANLSKGLIQEDSATLLGSMILARLQVATMARAALAPHQRPLFVIVVDELQTYAGEGTDTSSIRSLLDESRKYNVGFFAGTQFASQLARDVQAAIFGNVGTLIAMRCGIFDAQLLSKEMGQMGADDILNLDVGEAIVRMERSAASFKMLVDEVRAPSDSHRDEIVALSRERYCRPRAEVEAMLLERGVDAGPVTFGSSSAIPFGSDERRFLAHLVAHPDFTVTQLYAGLGLSSYKGDRVKRKLMTADLVTQIAAPLGKRGRSARFLVPSAEAYSIVGASSPRGKGGQLHRLMQRIVERKARALGYEAQAEVPVESGHVDVVLVGRNGRVAVEVEVRSPPSQRQRNLEKCLKLRFDQVVLLFVNGRERDAAASALSFSGGPPAGQRVDLTSIAELESCL